MEFILGFACGMAVMFGFSFLATYAANRESADVSRRLKRLERHFICGSGIVGCTNGPNCPWDHK